jgi:hypothetical protein
MMFFVVESDYFIVYVNAFTDNIPVKRSNDGPIHPMMPFLARRLPTHQGEDPIFLAAIYWIAIRNFCYKTAPYEKTGHGFTSYHHPNQFNTHWTAEIVPYIWRTHSTSTFQH